jgi:hypothetical protein
VKAVSQQKLSSLFLFSHGTAVSHKKTGLKGIKYADGQEKISKQKMKRKEPLRNPPHSREIK